MTLPPGAMNHISRTTFFFSHTKGKPDMTPPPPHASSRNRDAGYLTGHQLPQALNKTVLPGLSHPAYQHLAAVE